eukprot:4692417-Pleurochrysis_carterae.AAC.1
MARYAFLLLLHASITCMKTRNSTLSCNSQQDCSFPSADHVRHLRGWSALSNWFESNVNIDASKKCNEAMRGVWKHIKMRDVMQKSTTFSVIAAYWRFDSVPARLQGLSVKQYKPRTVVGSSGPES